MPRKRPVERTAAREKRFLAALARGLSVGGAAREAGLAYRTVYRWRAVDPDFAARWAEAYEEGTDTLEDEARRRAITGVESPVYFGGKEVGKVRKYSDPMLMFILRARRREKYGERATAEFLEAGDGPIGIDYAGLSKLEFTQRLAVLTLRLAEGDGGAQFAGTDRAVGAAGGSGEPGDADSAADGVRQRGG